MKRWPKPDRQASSFFLTVASSGQTHPTSVEDTSIPDI